LILVNKNNTLQVLAFFFIFAGFLVKIAVVPFNLWSARYSQNESSVSTSSLPVISAVSSIFIFLVILYSIFNTIPLVWQKSVFIVSVVLISAGNIVALLQKDINRFIAWSSSVQVFYIIAGIIARSQLAMTSVIFYTVCFGVSTLALIGVVGTVTESTGRSPVSSFRGLYRSNPGLGLAMTLALLSLAGIPPLAGFFGRFMVFTASAEKGFFFLLLIISANTLVSFYYYLRLVRTIFQDESGYSVPVIRNGFPFRLALTICIALIILAGFSGSLFDMLRDMSFGV
jgi:NADH-quinone oxidoreductase subunit N